jgi:hypothetical protein
MMFSILRRKVASSFLGQDTGTPAAHLKAVISSMASESEAGKEGRRFRLRALRGVFLTRASAIII